MITSADASASYKRIIDDYRRAIEAVTKDGTGTPAPSDQDARHAAYAAALAALADEIRAARAQGPGQQPIGPLATRLHDARQKIKREAKNAERAAEEDKAAELTVDVQAVVKQAIQAAVGEELTDLAQEITDLAEARLAEQYAGVLVPEKSATELRAVIAREDAEQTARLLHAAARDTKEWQSRRRRAVEAAEDGLADRELPPGFGAPVLGANGRARTDASGRVIRNYGLGTQSRVAGVAGISLSDTGGLAALLLGALPEDDRDLDVQVFHHVVRFIGDHGRHEFGRRLLDGSLTFRCGPRMVTFTLDPGDLGDAHHVRGIHTEGVPIGSKRHHAVEADQQLVSGTRREVASNRSVTLTANALTPFGAVPHRAWSATAGGAISGSSSVSYENGSDVVSAAKRAPRYEGLSAYFDFPSASIQAVVTGGGQMERVGRTDVTVRLAFPEEIAPEKDANDPPGAFRDPPRQLPTSRLLGVSQEHLQARHASGDATAEDVEKALEALPHHFLHLAESAGDMSGLREQVLRTMFGNRPRDEQVVEAVRDVLGEPWFLKRYGDITASGALSPLIRDSKGNELGYLKVKARLRTAQASSLSHLGLKEEVQRFVSAWDSKAQGGGVTLTLPAFEFGHVLGDPTASLGGAGNFSVGGEISTSFSSSRSQDVNTGSGDIRGTVIWGNSVLYLSDFQITADWITGRGQVTHRDNLRVNWRIPELERARFEYLIARAAGEDPAGAEPVDDEPDATGSERHPPAVMTASRGSAFSGALEMPGAEKLLDRVVEMIKEVDGPLPNSPTWTPPEEAKLEAELGTRIGQQALKAHVGELFQPGGTRMVLYRPANNGVEIITVSIAATHGPKVAAKGRVNKTTLEVMPSAFAGNGGTDSLAAGVGGFGQLSFLKGLGSGEHQEPRGVGFQVQAGFRSGQSVETTAVASGFTLQAMLYGPEPARYFRYDDVRYKIKVDVRHEKYPTASVLRLLGSVLVGAVSDGRAAFTAPAASSLEDDTLRGSVTFIMHEALTRTEPEPAAVIAEVGKVVTNITRKPPKAAGIGRALLNEARLPDLGPHLGPDGPDSFDYIEDQVMEVLGSAAISRAISGMLRELRLDDEAVGDLPWTISAPDFLASALVRGRAINMHTIVQSGIAGDRHAEVMIEGVPTGVQQDGHDVVKLFQMHVAEGSAVSGDAVTGSRAIGGTVSVPGLLLGRVGFQWLNMYTYGHTWGKSEGQSLTMTPTTGRLTQGTREYLEYTADMVWRITVTARDKNMLKNSELDYRSAILKISRGVSFLRRVEAAPDPRDNPQVPDDLDVPAVIGRIDASRPPASRRRTRPVAGGCARSLSCGRRAGPRITGSCPWCRCCRLRRCTTSCSRAPRR